MQPVHRRSVVHLWTFGRMLAFVPTSPQEAALLTVSQHQRPVTRSGRETACSDKEKFSPSYFPHVCLHKTE